MTKRQLQKLFDGGDINSSQKSGFYKSVRAFYVRAFEYALENLPLKDELLRNARFTNFISRDSTSFSEVEYFVERSAHCIDYVVHTDFK